MQLLFFNPFRNTFQVLERYIGSSANRVRRAFTSEMDHSDMTDAERDLRSGDQWILSVIAYLEFRYGKAWRKIHRLGERDNPVRWYSLSAARLLHELRYFNAAPCDCARYCAAKRKKPVASAHEVPTWSLTKIRKAAGL